MPQVPSSSIFSLQIDPLPADPNTLVNYPIMMMFDVVCNSVNKIFLYLYTLYHRKCPLTYQSKAMLKTLQ